MIYKKQQMNENPLFASEQSNALKIVYFLILSNTYLHSYKKHLWPMHCMINIIKNPVFKQHIFDQLLL